MSTDNDSEVRGLCVTEVKREAFPSKPFLAPHEVIYSALTCNFRTCASALRATRGIVAGKDLLLQCLHACGLMQGALMHLCCIVDRRIQQVMGT